MRTYAFIDASNLFYGGLKSLGWSIDYYKLLPYLKEKYQVEKAYYFGGIEIAEYVFDYLENDTVSLSELEECLLVNKNYKNEYYQKELKRLAFYKKLETFGYSLRLKPVKEYKNPDGSISRKANCDVDMTLSLTKHSSDIDRAIVLTGDGDFLPVLKMIKERSTEVIILSRSKRTAKEIKQFAKGNFNDFEYLKYLIQREEKQSYRNKGIKEEAHTSSIRLRSSEHILSKPVDKSSKTDYK